MRGWLARIMGRLFNGRRHRVEETERRTEDVVREAKRTETMIKNYRRVPKMHR